MSNYVNKQNYVMLSTEGFPQNPAEGSTLYYVDNGAFYIYYNNIWRLQNNNINIVSSQNQPIHVAVSQEYEETERQIGTWFGTPLYRKVIKISQQEYSALSDDSNKKILPLGFNVDLLLRGDITVKYTDTNNNTKSYFMHSVGTGTYDMGVHNCVNNEIQIYVGQNILQYLTDYIYITLEYTKGSE